MARRGLALIAVLASLAVVVTPAASGKPRKAHLTAFSKCSTFVHYARRHALGELRTMGTPTTTSPFPVLTGPPTRATPPSAVAAPESNAGGTADDFSGTNVQEKGVDEPDLVKTDGRRIFVAEGGMLFAIDARSDPPKLLGSLKLGDYGQQLLLDGDTLLVLGGAGIAYPMPLPVPVALGAPAPAPRAASPIAYPSSSSTLTQVDVSDPARMRVVKTMSVDGGYVDARMTGHSVRVVFSAIPQAIPALATTARPAARRAKIRRSTTPLWRPSYAVRRGVKGRASRRALVRCTAIARPAAFSGLNSLTVLTIDLAKGLDPVDSDAVMTDAQLVYASTKSLYVATQKAIAEQPASDQPPPGQLTEIHKFDITDPGETTYLGSGAVTGTLLNQFSMSEKDGLLRVASTQAPLWWSPGANTPSQSYVTVLAERGGALTQVGRVGGLGEGQRIYAVRFIGDVGYVVTFRQVDPLYTIGLSDPANPRVLGALDLLGYSAYLHPVGDGLLLGVGQAANEQGRTEGTQLSLFDVSDPAKPARIAAHTIASGSSSAEFDHHAFLWWDPLQLAVLPMTIYDYDEQKGIANEFAGAIGFHVAKADGISETGRISHPSAQGYPIPIDRSLVVGDRLFTVSPAGIEASALPGLADQGFVEFPQPEPQTGSGTAEPGQTVSSPPSK